MEEIVKRLTECVNKEMMDYDITIKDYALRCDVSYSVMRKISNGQATDLLLSTIDKICENSHFDLDEILEKTMDYKIERVLSRCMIIYNNADRYSISVSKYR